MASIQSRTNKDGSKTFKLDWRTYSEREFTKKGRAAAEAEEKAVEVKVFLDANGNTFKLAAKAKTKKDSTKPTVAGVVQRHIDLMRKPQPGTIDKYRGYLANHIEPSDLGAKPVDRVTREDVITWMDGLVAMSRANQPTGQRLSRKSKINIHYLLSDALKTAIDEEVMTRNPARGVAEADTDEAEEDLVYLSEDDLKMLEAESPEHYRQFVKTLGLTGMRYSEATALRKRDVRITTERPEGAEPLQRATIRITRAWKDGGKGKGEVLGPPKSKKAVRNIPCPRGLSAQLIAHLEQLEREDLIFRRPTGEYLRNSWFHKEVWQPLTKRLMAEKKLDEKPRIHDIRAAHTTHLLDKNVPVHRVQARLGHEDPKTTLKIYARLGKDHGSDAADVLEA